MSLSKYQRKFSEDEFSEGEPVLTFHGLRIRTGHAVTVEAEHKAVKFLACYPRGTADKQVTVGYPPHTQPQGTTLQLSQASSPFQGPEPLSCQPVMPRSRPAPVEPAGLGGSTARSSNSEADPTSHEAGSGVAKVGSRDSIKAVPSTSRPSPSTSESVPITSRAGPSTSRAGCSTIKAVLSTSRVSPNTSKAVASTSRATSSTSETVPSSSEAVPSTSRGMHTSGAGPSTSKAVPSTSRADRSTIKAVPSTSRGGTNTNGAGPSTSKALPSTTRASPSTSESVPSTSRAGPSTSRSDHSTSEAMPGTCRAGPSTIKEVPSTSRGGTNTNGAGPSTSKAVPSTSRASPSTSESVPSTSRAGPSTSRSDHSTSEAMPGTCRAGPSTIKAVPSTSRASPSTSESVPSTSRAGPSTSRAGCSTSEAVPSTSKTSPSTREAVHSTSKAVASPSKAVPSTSRARPNTSKAVPSTSRASPSTSESVPSTSRASPNTSTAVPSTSRASPSTSESVPGPSRAGPSTSKAGPSTSKAVPSTSRASPSTSGVGPCSSEAAFGRRAGSRRVSPGMRSWMNLRMGSWMSTWMSSTASVASFRSIAESQNAMFQVASSGPPAPEAEGASTTAIPTSSGPQEPAFQQEQSQVVSDWDYEWVPENRVLRYSRAQLKKDNDFTIFKLTRNAWEPALHQGYHQFSINNDRKSDPSDSKEGTSTATHPSFKIRDEKGLTQRSKPWRGRQGAGVRKQESPVQFEMHISLSDCLMSLLMQDWEMVCLGKNLCNLPAKVSVEAILDEYAIDLTSCGTRDKNYEASALVTILKEYFNVILSTQLLYDFERAQYAELVNSYPSSQLSQIYGGIYLLRLLKQLGPMFNHSTLDESCLMVLMTHIQDLLDYLAFTPTLLFIDASDYDPASDKYLKVAT